MGWRVTTHFVKGRVVPHEGKDHARAEGGHANAADQERGRLKGRAFRHGVGRQVHVDDCGAKRPEEVCDAHPMKQRVAHGKAGQQRKQPQLLATQFILSWHIKGAAQSFVTNLTVTISK